MLRWRWSAELMKMRDEVWFSLMRLRMDGESNLLCAYLKT
jgi:hypothetical protein